MKYIANDGIINHQQNNYRDCQVIFPKIIIKLKKTNKQQEVNNEMIEILNNNLHISYEHITTINLHIKTFILSFTFKHS